MDLNNTYFKSNLRFLIELTSNDAHVGKMKVKEELSHRVGVSPSTINRWAGNNSATPKSIGEYLRLSNALNVSLYDLIYTNLCVNKKRFPNNEPLEEFINYNKKWINRDQKLKTLVKVYKETKEKKNIGLDGVLYNIFANYLTPGTTGYDMIQKEQREQSSPIHSTKTSVNTDKNIEKCSKKIAFIIILAVIIFCFFAYFFL